MDPAGRRKTPFSTNVYLCEKALSAFMYSILDIESTGGKYNEEGIIEIAICQFDGHQTVDQLSSLIKPSRPVQPFVQKLTGIEEKMLRRAPEFHQVARRIVEMTEGSVLVAHNVDFDYRMLRLEFKRLGFQFNRKTLDTVELSRKLLPGMPSYSLGKLCRSLGIPVVERHRARGDALATLKLFSLLLDRDCEKQIVKTSITSIRRRGKLAPKLKALAEQLPHKTGVYYLRDENGQIFYIGKSLDIKNRVVQHFSSQSKKAEKIQRAVDSVSYEETGSELIALLKESEEIKRIKPLLNRAQRRERFGYGLYTRYNSAGYQELYLSKAPPEKTPIMCFATLKGGIETLYAIIQRHTLCAKHCNVYKSQTSCFGYQIKTCKGACIGAEQPEDYNQRVSAFIESCSLSSKNLLLIEKGRSSGEKSVVLIENGCCKGYAFFELNNQITKPDILKKIIIPMRDNRDVGHILKRFLQREKFEKRIEWKAETEVP